MEKEEEKTGEQLGGQTIEQDVNSQSSQVIMDQMVTLWPCLNAAERTVLSDFVLDQECLDFANKLIIHLNRKYKKALDDILANKGIKATAKSDITHAIIKKKIDSSEEFNVKVRLVPTGLTMPFFVRNGECITKIWEKVVSFYIYCIPQAKSVFETVAAVNLKIYRLDTCIVAPTYFENTTTRIYDVNDKDIFEFNWTVETKDIQTEKVVACIEKKDVPLVVNGVTTSKPSDNTCTVSSRPDNVIRVTLQLLPYNYSCPFYIDPKQTVAQIWKSVVASRPHFHLTRSYIDVNSVMFSLTTKKTIYSCSDASQSSSIYMIDEDDVIEFNWKPILVVKTTIEKPKAVKKATVRVHFGPISYQTSFNFHIYQGESVSEIWKRAYNVAIHAGYDLSNVDMNSVSLVHGNETVDNANLSPCVLAYQNLATLFFDWKTIVSDCSNKPSEYIVQEKQISDPTIESTKTEPVKTVETIVKPVLVHFILRPFGIQTFFSSAINQGQTVGFIWNKTVLLSTGYSIKQDSIDYDTLSFKQYHSGCVKKCIEHVNNPANAQELLYFEEGDILEFDWNTKPVPTFQVAIKFFPLARLGTLKYFQVKQGETASEIWKRAIALASKTESFPVNIISPLSTSIVHYRNKVTLSKIEPAWSSKSIFQIQDGDYLELDWVYSTFTCNVYLAPLQATISLCLNPTESLFSIFHRAMNSVSSKHSSSTQNFKDIYIWSTTNKTSPIDVPFHSCVKDCVLDPSSTIHFSWTQ